MEVIGAGLTKLQDSQLLDRPGITINVPLVLSHCSCLDLLMSRRWLSDLTLMIKQKMEIALQMVHAISILADAQILTEHLSEVPPR